MLFSIKNDFFRKHRTNELDFDLYGCISDIHHYIVNQRDNIVQFWFDIPPVQGLQHIHLIFQLAHLILIPAQYPGVAFRMGPVGYHHILHLLDLFALGRDLGLDFIYLRPDLSARIQIDTLQYLFVEGEDGGGSD